MTAINVVVTSDGLTGFMLTDTAGSVRGQLGVIAFSNKAAVLPLFKGLVAVRGNACFQDAAAKIVGAFPTFDEMVKCVGPVLTMARSMMSPEVQAHEWELVVVGISETTSEVKAFLAESVQNFEPQYHQMIFRPEIDPTYVSVGDFGGRITFIDAPRDLLRIMKAQRKRSMYTDDPAMFGVIGGEAVLSIITRDDVSQRVIHRWNDEIGKTIN